LSSLSDRYFRLLFFRTAGNRRIMLKFDVPTGLEDALRAEELSRLANRFP